MYLAIDPGGKRTGWAYFDHDGRPISDGIVDTENDFRRLTSLLQNMAPAVIIVEKFQLFPWKSMVLGWSQMRQSKVIGALELWCELKGTTLIEQPSSVMSMGFQYQGKKMPKSHPKDNDAARAHGVYYLVNIGKVAASGR